MWIHWFETKLEPAIDKIRKNSELGFRQTELVPLTLANHIEKLELYKELAHKWVKADALTLRDLVAQAQAGTHPGSVDDLEALLPLKEKDKSKRSFWKRLFKEEPSTEHSSAIDPDTCVSTLTESL